MKNFQKFLLLSVFCTCIFSTQAQNLKWATKLDSNNYVANAIVNDDLGNIYSAFNDGTGNTAVLYRTGTIQLFSQNTFGATNWQVELEGNGHIFDIVVENDKLYILGIVKDSIHIDTQWIYTLGSQQYSSFILCMNTSGIFQWVTPAAWTENNMLVNLKINNQKLYTVGLFDDVKSRFDSWDMSGNHLQAKIFDELRTLSDIEFDASNNIYLSGTGNPNGTIDTVPYTNTTPNSSYLIFLIKLNTTWQAQWIHLEPYVTFDFSPQVEIISDSIFLAYVGNTMSTGSLTNVEIQSFNTNGQSLLVENTDHSNGNFHFTKTIDYGTKKLIVAQQGYTAQPTFIHFFDTELNETRKDSLYKLDVGSMNLAGGVGGVNQYSIALSSYDSLKFNNQFALNLTHPNFTKSNATLCISGPILELDKMNRTYILNLYPNPTSDQIRLRGLTVGEYVFRIFDLTGKEYQLNSHQQEGEISFDISKLASGKYLLLDEANDISTSFVIQ